MTNEIICITRAGFNFLHGEGVELAAMVTAIRWEPGKLYDACVAPYQQLFVPRLVNGAPDWNTL